MNEEKIGVYLNYYYCIATLILAIVTVNQLNFISQYQTSAKISQKTVDYENFRSLNLPVEWIKAAVEEETDYTSYITYKLLANNFVVENTTLKDGSSIRNQVKRVRKMPAYVELYSYYQSIFSDLVYFPVPLQASNQERVSFDNSWGAVRTYGGDRRHEGTDLMASNNQRGYFPIISVSDGVVEKKGWLSQGGYRIGIRAPGGAYFYYAHLYDYAPGIKEGDTVRAGQLIGFMGDSGYGEEGTIGQFDVHLHFGIYIDSTQGEMSVNPYWILKYLEQRKLTFDYE